MMRSGGPGAPCTSASAPLRAPTRPRSRAGQQGLQVVEVLLLVVDDQDAVMGRPPGLGAGRRKRCDFGDERLRIDRLFDVAVAAGRQRLLAIARPSRKEVTATIGTSRSDSICRSARATA